MDKCGSIVYGNEKRMFVNTALGCSAKCKYCYLPSLGFNNKPIYFAAKIAIDEVLKQSYFIPGKKGTIISIGCYSECWDDHNKNETIKIIKYFSELGNYIQMATKKEISIEDIYLIDSMLKYDNQMGIYLSAPSISNSNELEPGTDTIDKRMNSLKYKSIVRKIYFVLYIKPVLRSITILDVDRYASLICDYDIKVVVGPLLELRKDKDFNVELVGEERLNEVKCYDNELLISKLNEIGMVYTHSTDIVNEFRLSEVDDNDF